MQDKHTGVEYRYVHVCACMCRTSVSDMCCFGLEVWIWKACTSFVKSVWYNTPPYMRSAALQKLFFLFAWWYLHHTTLTHFDDPKGH